MKLFLINRKNNLIKSGAWLEMNGQQLFMVACIVAFLQRLFGCALINYHPSVSCILFWHSVQAGQCLQSINRQLQHNTSTIHCKHLKIQLRSNSFTSVGIMAV
jgi:hypothetical protein